MPWSKRDNRPLRHANFSPSSTSQKASPSDGSAALPINNPTSSLSASAAIDAAHSRDPLSPLDTQLTPSSHQSRTAPLASSRKRIQSPTAEMPSVEIGKHITSNFGGNPAPQQVRRKSVTSQSQATPSNVAVPPSQQPGTWPRQLPVLDPTQPDPYNQANLQSPAPRRPSVPSTTSFSASSTVIQSHNAKSSVQKSMQATDEIYRDLSTYTFGAARPPLPSPSPSYEADVELDKSISPLTPLPRRGSSDRTPRSSVVAMSHGYSSHPTQSHGSERIPLLPPLHSRRPPWDLDKAPIVTNLAREGEYSDALDSDDVDGRPDFIRNREHFRALIPRGDPVQSDTASRHTFGGRGINSSSASLSSFTSASADHSLSSLCMDYYSSDDDNAQVEAPDDVDDEEEIDVGLGHMVSLDPFPRRRSHPLPIPGATPVDRNSLLIDERDANLASHRRPSRSLDDDMNLSSFADPPLGIGPRSEPSTRGSWAALQAQEQNGSDPDPFAGLNLGYILGGHDLSGFRRASDAPSYVQPVRKGSQGSQPFYFGLGWNGRRSSTATTISGPDDTFLRHLNKYNEGYGTQISYWTFKKEKADGGMSRPWTGNGAFPSPRGSISDNQKLIFEGRSKTKEKSFPANLGMVPGTQEIWKCENVGRFKVDRQTYKPDPSKPPHQRVNLRHILDPYSRGNTRGGPSVTIHKHSRAIAFSIYRAHNLTSRNRLRPGILLAPKKVQERFTITKTTAKLVTHGLLEDRSSDSPVRTSSVGRKEKDRHKPIEDATRAKLKHGMDKGNENQSHLGNSKDAVRPQESSISPKDIPVSDVTNTETRPLSSDSATFKLNNDATLKDPYLRRESTTSDQSTIKSLYMHRGRRDSLDFEYPPSRTPHAETYGTLDSSIIQYVRARPDRLTEPDSNPSFFKRLLRPLPRSTLQASGHTAGLTSAQLEGNYKPPWMAMAPRARQEETDRVIHNLNNSFKGVGLLPASAKPASKGKKSVRSTNRTRADILEHVPEESLYMLLPLWPGETDSISSMTQTSTRTTIPLLEERHYLLVYYVPRPEKRKKGQQQRRQRSRSQTSSSDSTSPQDDRSVILSEFHVCARLVSYNELRGSGVRLPGDGLSVTGPMLEAVQSIPDPATLKGRQSDWVIALYHGRERGVELVPGGLMELGLCLPTPVRNPPLYPLREEECDETQEACLSPMGRAAVEMAWAGCIALSSFGPV